MRALNLIICLSCFTGLLNADLTTDAKEAAIYCSREVFTAFYPPVFVSKTLEAFGIPEEKRLEIIGELKARESEIVSLVEKNAETIEPNPLYQSNQQKTVVNLFDKAVLTVFSEVMNKNGVDDQGKIVTMMQDVHRQKADRFKECMELNH
jgi:hypothetical protein